MSARQGWAVALMDTDGEDHLFGPCAERTARHRERVLREMGNAADAVQLGPMKDLYIVARAWREEGSHGSD